MAEDRFDLKKPHFPTRDEIAEYENVMERFPREPMRKKFFTPLTTLGVGILVVGFIALIFRFVFGLGAVTNLSHGYPWGLWITFDVVIGIALASGGYMTAALVYVFNQGQYSPLVRPAIVTAMLGYAMAGFGVFVDVGRWWQLYNPVIPGMQNGSSPLFEVSICVMSYLTVLIIEFIPTLADRWIREGRGKSAARAMRIRTVLDKVMILFIILGITISTLHQSSLGSVMLLAPHRLHALWFTPWLPAFFLLSSFAVGWHVVIVESIISSRSFKLKPEMPLLSGLAQRSIILLGLYVVGKFYNLVFYDQLHLLWESWYGLLWFADVALFAMIPAALLATPWIRRNPTTLMWTSWMVIAGLVLNRANVYIFAYEPHPGYQYFPSLWEWIISAFMVAVIVVGYKFFANYFPVLTREQAAQPAN